MHSLKVLEDASEWPRPESAPLRLADLKQYSRFTSSGFAANVGRFLVTSGIDSIASSTGYRLFTRSRTHPLVGGFLELYARSAAHNQGLDRSAFRSSFDQMWSELRRPDVVLRQVIALDGLPRPPWKPDFQGGSASSIPSAAIDLVRYDRATAHLALHSLLRLDRQPLSLESLPIGEGTLIVHDVTFIRGSEDAAIAAWEQLHIRSTEILRALYLATPGRITIEATYTAQIADVPFIPLIVDTGGDYRRVITYHPVDMTAFLKHRIRRLLTVCNNSHIAQHGLATPVERFMDGFRWRNNSQNIIDLVVSLEALFSIPNTEMSYRLQMHVASLLGANDNERRRIAERISCAYYIRSTLVHGKEQAKRTPEQAIRDAIKKVYPKDAAQPDLEDALRQLVSNLRDYVRTTLIARLLYPASWPLDGDWTEIVLNRTTSQRFRRSLKLIA